MEGETKTVVLLKRIRNRETHAVVGFSRETVQRRECISVQGKYFAYSLQVFECQEHEHKIHIDLKKRKLHVFFFKIKKYLCCISNFLLRHV